MELIWGFIQRSQQHVGMLGGTITQQAVLTTAPKPERLQLASHALSLGIYRFYERNLLYPLGLQFNEVYNRNTIEAF